MPLPPVPGYRIPPNPEPMPPPPEVAGAGWDIGQNPPPGVVPPIEIPDRPVPVPKPKPRAGTLPPDPAPAATPVPQLGQLLTDDQVREYSGELDQALKQTAAILGSVGRRALTRNQRSLAERARSLVGQAEAQRSMDLLTARNLAKRALILSQELQRTLK
jgi:hypothetical protein